MCVFCIVFCLQSYTFFVWTQNQGRGNHFFFYAYKEASITTNANFVCTMYLAFSLGSNFAEKNVLYVGHPHIKEEYIPFKGSDNELMISQYNELASILVCLGATEINIKVIKGKKIDETTKHQLNAKLNVDLKLAKVEGHYTSDKEKREKSDSNTAMDLTLTAKPTALPFIPQNVIWYLRMQKWQETAQLRLNGNTLNYVLKLSSQNASCVLDEERATIKASIILCLA